MKINQNKEITLACFAVINIYNKTVIKTLVRLALLCEAHLCDIIVITNCEEKTLINLTMKYGLNQCAMAAN